MLSQYRRMLLVLLHIFIISAGLVSSQDTPTPTATTPEADSPIILEPFTVEVADSEMSGVIPSDWDVIQAGVAIRNDNDGINATYILHIVAPNMSLDAAIEPLLVPLQLQTLPEELATYDGQQFTWTFYDVAYQPPQLEGGFLQVLIATANTEDGAFIIVLQAHPEDFDNLYETVMKPALNTFGLALDDIRQYLGLSDFTTVSIEEFAIQADIPAQWQMVNAGAYMRAETETDFTTLLIQTSPDLGEREFADLLRETLGLTSALPTEGDSLALGSFDWTLYRIDFTSQETDITLHIATATDDTRTMLVGFLSTTEEADRLVETLLVPILSSIETQ
ncbi:MAG: hypothetical protein Q9P44_05350 [Anaerolineae bacterium]|nr:hypothetical protein [Anaerolineae bacterium]